MHKSKKERLEAKGWRLGSAQEFLGLSDEEAAYVELRLRLADSLRVRRQKRKLSQTDLAKMLRSSQSRVAKIEGGDPSVSIARARRSTEADRSPPSIYATRDWLERSVFPRAVSLSLLFCPPTRSVS